MSETESACDAEMLERLVTEYGPVLLMEWPPPPPRGALPQRLAILVDLDEQEYRQTPNIGGILLKMVRQARGVNMRVMLV